MLGADPLTDRTGDIAGKPLPALLQRNALHYGDRKVALREKEFGIWQPVTWKQYYEHVRDFALGLRSLGFSKTGHHRGQPTRVALCRTGGTIPRWYTPGHLPGLHPHGGCVYHQPF
jgi:hypothetical protein